VNLKSHARSAKAPRSASALKMSARRAAVMVEYIGGIEGGERCHLPRPLRAMFAGTGENHSMSTPEEVTLPSFPPPAQPFT